MGALSSVGMSDSTIGNLSQALGYLGSGNLSALQGSNMQNLLVMGAARSGLSYGSILNQGLTADVANTLLSGIASYIAEMGGSSSNVVKSEYARIFGLSGVSDIAAAGNITDAMMAGIESSTIGSDIAELLNNTDRFVYATTKIENILENFMYSTATNIASSPSKYLSYRTVDFISSMTTQLIGEGGGDIAAVAKIAANLAPWAMILGMGGDSEGKTGIGAALSSIKNMGKSVKSLFANMGGAISGGDAGAALNIFNALATGVFGSSAVGFAGS